MDKSQIKVSVIIPMYNAEKYIEQCISSLMKQTYQDFEVIIVDDGSIDRSMEICSTFALQYENIHIVHKKNEGLIAARIEGLHHASGCYISFVDADDWVDKDFLELLVTLMESGQADIVITGCIKEDANVSEKVVNHFDNGIYEYEDLIKSIFPKMLYFQGFYEFGILPYMWNKLYKKDKLLECYEGIDTEIYDGEDVAVVFPYLLHTNRAVICDDAKYHYRIHNMSMTADKKPDYYVNVAKLYLYLYGKFQHSEFSECMLKQLDQYMRRMIWNGNPRSFIEADQQVFPFDKIPKGASIVLYAAGNVGRRYYSQIQRTRYCHLEAWIDGNWESDELKQLGIESPNVLAKKMFDYVVIAIEKPDVVEQVRKTLIKSGIEESKII